MLHYNNRMAEYKEFHFSKEYVTAYGVMVYLQGTLNIKGVCKTDHNEKYFTICVMIDSRIKHFLEVLSDGLDSPVVLKSDSNGDFIYIKVKKPCI